MRERASINFVNFRFMQRIVFQRNVTYTVHCNRHVLSAVNFHNCRTDDDGCTVATIHFYDVSKLVWAYLQSWTKVLWTVLQYSYFVSFFDSLLKQCILLEILLQLSLPLPHTKLKLGKKSGYTRPPLFVGWGKGLDLCELENAPETQKWPKTLVHDCSLAILLYWCFSLVSSRFILK